MDKKEEIKKILSKYLSDIPYSEEIANHLFDDLDQLINSTVEENHREKGILINWLSNLERKIMRHDEFKGLRGYPITHFQEKYIIPKPPKE